MDRRLARTLVALNVGYLIGISVYIVRGFNKIFAESDMDIHAMEYAHQKVNVRILSGAYADMTTEQLEQAIENDFEAFRMEARLND
jgi:hypothetical protein